MEFTSKQKAVVASLAIAVAGIGAYWYYSPYMAMKSLRAAAEARDAEAFNEKVDYPRLRESLKGQMAAMVAGKVGAGSSSGNQFEALGSALALALINPVIDAMVRPETVMKAMSKGELSMKPTRADAGPANDGKRQPKWDVDRISANKIVAYAQDEKDAGAAKFGVVFERSGFADWKLTELRMPTPPTE